MEKTIKTFFNVKEYFLIACVGFYCLLFFKQGIAIVEHTFDFEFNGEEAKRQAEKHAQEKMDRWVEKQEKLNGYTWRDYGRDDDRGTGAGSSDHDHDCNRDR